MFQFENLHMLCFIRKDYKKVFDHWSKSFGIIRNRLVISKKIKEQKHEIPFSLSQVGLLDFYSGL